MKKKLFVISVVFFFMSACSKEAVNSWELRKHTIVQSQYRDTDQWHIEETFPTYEQCMEQRDSRIKDDRAAFERLCKDMQDMKTEDSKDGISCSGNIGGRFFSRMHSYTCLTKAV